MRNHRKKFSRRKSTVGVRGLANFPPLKKHSWQEKLPSGWEEGGVAEEKDELPKKQQGGQKCCFLRKEGGKEGKITSQGEIRVPQRPRGTTKKYSKEGPKQTKHPGDHASGAILVEVQCFERPGRT